MTNVTDCPSEMNVALGRFLLQEFPESVRIVHLKWDVPGPDRVWFEVDPSAADGWKVIRWLLSFLEGREEGELHPRVYEGPPKSCLYWDLSLRPECVSLLREFFRLKKLDDEHINVLRRLDQVARTSCMTSNGD